MGGKVGKITKQFYCIFLCSLLLLGVIYGQTQSLNSELSEYISNSLEESVFLQKNNLILRVNSDIQIIKNMAQIMESSSSHDTAFTVLSALTVHPVFRHLFFVDIIGLVR